MYTFSRSSNSTRGYSLVELIVAIGLFSVVMLLATTGYLTLMDMDRGSRAYNDLTNNFSFGVESMARSIRTGTGYGCWDMQQGSYGYWYCNYDYGGQDCFSFTDQQGREVTYMLMDTGSIGRYIGQSPGDRSCNSSTATPITDPNIHVDSLRFYMRGSPLGDELQSAVLFTIGGYINIKQNGVMTPVRFSVQTQATQRQLDI